MAEGTPSKINRNKKIVELKEKLSFRELAKIFGISATRAKQIYDREVAKIRKGT